MRLVQRGLVNGTIAGRCRHWSLGSLLLFPIVLLFPSPSESLFFTLLLFALLTLLLFLISGLTFSVRKSHWTHCVGTLPSPTSHRGPVTCLRYMWTKKEAKGLVYATRCDGPHQQVLQRWQILWDKDTLDGKYDLLHCCLVLLTIICQVPRIRSVTLFYAELFIEGTAILLHG